VHSRATGKLARVGPFRSLRARNRAPEAISSRLRESLISPFPAIFGCEAEIDWRSGGVKASPESIVSRR
jgi:hypothetical protein